MAAAWRSCVSEGRSSSRSLEARTFKRPSGQSDYWWEHACRAATGNRWRTLAVGAGGGGRIGTAWSGSETPDPGQVAGGGADAMRPGDEVVSNPPDVVPVRTSRFGASTFHRSSASRVWHARPFRMYLGDSTVGRQVVDGQIARGARRTGHR